MVPALAVLATLLVGCSTVPTSSPNVVITQAPNRSDEPVGIEPVSPEKGATPEEVVRGFIDAAASSTRQHPVAREYLTPQAAKSWSDETGITIISPSYSAVTTEAGAVRVSADWVGNVDPRGIFSLSDQENYSREYTLEKVGKEWRIADPPDGLVMLLPDFSRLYDQLPAYFLDPTGQRLVPDPRYLIAGDSQPTALINRELDGASAALAAGVKNPLEGAQLRRAITVSSQIVTVDLTGLSPNPSPELSELCAQVVWTLQPFGARSVQVLIDGEPVSIDGIPSVQTVDTWASYSPEGAAVDAVGHYVFNGAVYTVDGKPVPGPAGAGAYGLTSAAVSANADGQLTTMAGTTAAAGGATLLMGAYGGDLAPVLAGDTLSVPTVAATRDETWVVRGGDEIVRVPAGGPAQAVATPTLGGLGRATVLQLSPDGVRAAVVIDGPEGPRLYVGTVNRSPDGGVSLPDLRQVAPSLSQVVDVAWRTSSSLLLLARDPGQARTVPYTVGVDGWNPQDVGTAGLPNEPTAVAAAPDRQPLVSAAGSIWEFSAGTWVTLIAGQEPLPGTEPFFPM
nr:LpqB family beta-propeller domain-containing protein [Petropleomorpha daqingensis]